jgi:DnaK suppressor protein
LIFNIKAGAVTTASAFLFMKKSKIRQLILQEIEKTSDLVDKYRDLSSPVAPENAIGRVSRMDAINNKSVNEAALRKAEAKLGGLRNALSRLDEPDFGYCAKCKAPIPPARILIMPHTRTCVGCSS